MIPARRPLRLMLAGTACLAALALLSTAVLALWVVRGFPGTAELPAECAVVFGAAVHRGEDPGPGILRRTQTAARLYREDRVERLFLTGGKGEPGVDSEAAVMRRVALREGVAPEDIVLEEAARSTWENLELVRPLTADCDAVVGISDRYHLARIRYLASRQGWGILQTYPADVRAPSGFELRSVAREILALGYYVLRGDRLTGGAGLPDFGS